MEKDKNTLVWILIAVIAIFFLIGSFGMGGYGILCCCSGGLLYGL